MRILLTGGNGQVGWELQKTLAALGEVTALGRAELEEIAYRMGFIDAAQLEALAEPLARSGYGEYLRRVLSEKVFW